jgi:WD repeat-containing protein 19
MRQWAEAAVMYERAGALEKAAALYIQTKNWTAAAPLMPKITAPRLHIAYAKSREADGQYKDAVAAFEAAKDWDSVVRLLLQQLNQPDRAFEIVRRTRSPEAAQLAARFCQSTGDAGAAVEFLLLARKSEDAFQLASTANCMDRYAAALGPDASAAECTAVAQYYEERNQPAKAGRMYARAGQHARALRLLLACGEAELDTAIDVVGSAHSDALTRQLIDFLTGETDGVAKESRFVFKLYMALGRYAAAAGVAVDLSRADMEAGRYLEARNKLRDVARALAAQHIDVSAELQRDLTLLHSYVLVKTQININDHKRAARLLMRTAKSISRFPSRA